MVVLSRQLEAAEELTRLAARAELTPCADDVENAAGVTSHGSGKSADTLLEVAAECAAQVMLRHVAHLLLAQQSCMCGSGGQAWAMGTSKLQTLLLSLCWISSSCIA